MTKLGIRRDLIYIVLFVFLLSISYVSSTWTYTDPIHANDTYVTNLTVSENLTLPTQTPITSQYGNLYACSGGVCYVNDTNQVNELVNRSYADANYGSSGLSNPITDDVNMSEHDIYNTGVIYFGYGNDTNLYRSGANTLKTDDNLDANAYYVGGVEFCSADQILTGREIKISEDGDATTTVINNTKYINATGAQFWSIGAGAGYCVKTDANGNIYAESCPAGGGSGAGTYLDLNDTTDTTYTGKIGYVPVVNSTASGLELQPFPLNDTNVDLTGCSNNQVMTYNGTYFTCQDTAASSNDSVHEDYYETNIEFFDEMCYAKTSGSYIGDKWENASSNGGYVSQGDLCIFALNTGNTLNAQGKVLGSFSYYPSMHNLSIIARGKFTSTTSQKAWIGFIYNGTDYAWFYLDTGVSSSFSCQIGNGSTGYSNSISSGITVDTDYHLFKIKFNSTGTYWYIDGTLKCSDSDYPSQKQQLIISIRTLTTANRALKTDYVLVTGERALR